MCYRRKRGSGAQQTVGNTFERWQGKLTQMNSSHLNKRSIQKQANT